jgi:hypothetical protein
MAENRGAKHQGPPQVSVPSEKGVSRGVIEFEYRDNNLTVFLTQVHHPATRGLVECLSTNAERFANCRRHQQIVPKIGRGHLAIGMFPVEKANDCSLLELAESG